MLRGSFVLMAALCAAAQAPAPKPEPEAEAPSFTIQRNEVIVPVTVTDYKGRFISDLERRDFKVFEDNREQKIEYFSREHNQPVVVGVVLDLSNNSRMHWKNFQETAEQLVWALLSDDKGKKYSGFLVTFNTETELAVNTTPEPEPIVDKISKLKPGGGSALYDAIVLAISKHQVIKGEPIEPRRVLIVISDGNDNASKHTLDQVVELAQRNLVTIYVVDTSAYGFTNLSADVVARLTESTGGRVEAPLDGVYADVSGYISKPQDEGNYSLTVGSGSYSAAVASHMFDSITKIAGEISTQYILRYIPDTTTTARAYRSIKVTVDIPDVTVRTRRGYYPFAP